MRYRTFFSKRFRKQLRRLNKSGFFNHEKFEATLETLATGLKLDEGYRDHQLKGGMSGYREYHLSGDLVVVYEIDASSSAIIFRRIGGHDEVLQ